MKKHVLLSVLILGLTSVRAADSLSLDGKGIFTQGFPRLLAFRGEMVRTSHKDYAAWCSSVAGASGVIRKFVLEELPNLHAESAGWASRYAAENPHALMMLHLNGESRQVLDFPEVHRNYFPGHWVYGPGTRLTASAGPADSELQVQDASLFKVKAYLNRERDGGRSWFPQHVILVPLDKDGTRLWYESEYVIVKAVDIRRNVLTVDRRQIFSKSHAFESGQTVVAPLSAAVWGGKPMWFYNLSSACPVDRAGRTAADVFIREIAGWFAFGGILTNFNGIAFDVNYWKVRDPEWDTDNDGKSDGGFVQGRNIWREGGWRFFRNLRRALGDDRLITCDAQHEENQQAVGVLDGIESEGLVQHNDGFRGFSRTVNTHLYWQENNSRKHDLRYVVLKLMDENDAARGDQLRRFGTATACCLGAAVTGTSDPFLPPEFSAPGSLGFPAGVLIRTAQSRPDLLAGTDLLSRLKTDGCSVSTEDRHLLITAEPGTDPLRPMTVTLKKFSVPSGDVTVFVTMKSLDPLEGFAPEDRVPRLVRAKFSKTPDYGEGRRVNEFYTDLYGYIGMHGPSVLSFYLRRPGCGAEQMDVSFEIEGRGRAALYSITAHNAPDVLLRAFDRGVVAVNPALDPAVIPVAAFLPGIPGLPESLTIPSLDAQFISHSGGSN